MYVALATALGCALVEWLLPYVNAFFDGPARSYLVEAAAALWPAWRSAS